MRKGKVIAAFILTLALLLPVFIVLAQALEIEYPDVSGAETPTTTRTFLPDYINYIFSFAIGIAGLIAFVALLYGGIRYLTSAGSPGSVSEARSQILAALLAVVLLLGSYLLLTTINPQLVGLSIDKENLGRQGVVLFAAPIICPDPSDPSKLPDTSSLLEGKDFWRVKGNLSSLGDYSTQTPDDFTQTSAIGFLNSTIDMELFLYSEMDYQGTRWSSTDYVNDNGEILKVPSCINVGTVQSKSVELVWKRAGVYLFARPDCTGDVRLFTADSASFEGFDDRAKSIKIIPTLKRELAVIERQSYGGIAGLLSQFFPRALAGVTIITPEGEDNITLNVAEKFGAILFEHADFKGDATVWIGGDFIELPPPCRTLTTSYLPQEPYYKENVGNRASSIKIFKQLPENLLTPEERQASGEGVTLFSNYDFNEQEDPGEGNIHCGPINAQTEFSFLSLLYLGIPVFITTEIGEPVLYGGTDNQSSLACSSLLNGSRASSIKVSGNYIAVLFREDGRGEVFESPGDFRLKDNHIGDDEARYLLVIPIAQK